MSEDPRNRKLRLNSETVRILTSDTLNGIMSGRAVAGGGGGGGGCTEANPFSCDILSAHAFTCVCHTKPACTGDVCNVAPVKPSPFPVGPNPIPFPLPVI